jgi:gliding motility-associated-like protein
LLDLVITNTILNRVDVLINQSTATTFTFAAPIELQSSPEPWGVDLADIDGDDDIDIIVSNKYSQTTGITDFNIDLFLNNGSASPSFTLQHVIADQPTRNVKVNDFDGDGKPDISYTAFNETTQVSKLIIVRNANCHQADILNTETTLCDGRTIRLQAIPAGNVTFSWEKDAAPFGTNSPFVDITDGGLYKVTVTGESGTCITTDQITMTKSADTAPPKPDIIAQTPICAGSNLPLSTNATAAQFSWTGPDGFTAATASPTVSDIGIDKAGEFALQVTGANGCKSAITTVRVDVSDLSSFRISSPVSGNLCEGSTVTLSVNSPPNHTFQWKKGGADLTGETGATLSVTADGSYTVFVSNNDLANCTTETLPSVVTILAKPHALFDVKATACKDEALAFTNQSTVDNRATITYSWTFGDTQSSTETSPSHAYATTGSFTSKLVVQYTGVSGCSDNILKPITVAETVVPVINASAESACPDGEVELSVAGDFATNTWSTDETTKSIHVSPGEYTITTVDANGCEGSASVSIASLDVPVISIKAGRNAIKVGDTTQLTATGADTYTWTADETLSNTTIANPIAKALETTTYSVTGVASNSCTGQASITITVSGTLGFPPAFSPNGDGDNDTWNIRAENSPDCTLSIYNGSGGQVFQKKGQNWDGIYEGKVQPEGVYYYVFGCPGEKPQTGSVLLFK